MFFLASEESEVQNRNAFKERVAEFTDNTLLKDVQVSNWDMLFKVLVDTKYDSKPIIVIDEFQYIGKTKHMLKKSSYLYDEPNFLLQQEVSEIGSYFSIIKTIAAGHSKLSAMRVSWNRENRKVWYVLFSTGGFSDKLQELAKQREDVLLIDS